MKPTCDSHYLLAFQTLLLLALEVVTGTDLLLVAFAEFDFITLSISKSHDELFAVDVTVPGLLRPPLKKLLNVLIIIGKFSGNISF